MLELASVPIELTFNLKRERAVVSYIMNWLRHLFFFAASQVFFHCQTEFVRFGNSDLHRQILDGVMQLSYTFPNENLFFPTP